MNSVAGYLKSYFTAVASTMKHAQLLCALARPTTYTSAECLLFRRKQLPRPTVTTTHDTTFSGRFALPNFGRLFMFARHLDQR